MAVRAFFGVLTALLLCEGVAFGQSEPCGDLTTIAYPIAELVVPVSAGRSSEKVATNEAELMDRILKKVAQGAWDRAGGSGSMRFEAKGHLLHVRQTPAVHAELKAFLDKLKRGQVSLEMRVLSVSNGLLENIGLQWSERDGVRYFVFSDVQVFQLLEAAQGDQSTHILQFPKGTTFDGQDAKAEVGEWLTFRTGADVQVKGTKAFVVPKDEKFFSGVKTHFLPTISADRKHVNLQADMMTRNLLGKQPAMTPMSIALPDSVDDNGKPIVNPKVEMMVEKPAFTELKVAVAAKVPDQWTIGLLAGTSMQDKRTENAPPILSRVPYLSRLFRNKIFEREMTTTVFLLTTRILADSELETVHVERLRNGIQAEDDGLFPMLPRGSR